MVIRVSKTDVGDWVWLMGDGRGSLARTPLLFQEGERDAKRLSRGVVMNSSQTVFGTVYHPVCASLTFNGAASPPETGGELVHPCCAHFVQSSQYPIKILSNR